jgi:hypothetical protein
MIVLAKDLADVNRQWFNTLLLLKPVNVREIEVERQWFDVLWCLTSRLQVRLDRVNVLRIEMPVTSGAQKHPLRHVRPPKLHRLPHDHMLNLLVLRLRRE